MGFIPPSQPPVPFSHWVKIARKKTVTWDGLPVFCHVCGRRLDSFHDGPPCYNCGTGKEWDTRRWPTMYLEDGMDIEH